MIISRKKKFIFFACGKTGTTSIEKRLGKYHDGNELLRRVDETLDRARREESKPYTLKHARPSLVRQHMSEDEWDSYYKFVFVRNPWDWLLANYTFNNPNLAYHLYKFDQIHVDAIWYFLKLHNQSDNTDGGYHQHEFVLDKDDTQLVDFVGRFENLQSGYDTVCDKIGIKSKQLPHTNRSNHRDYRTLYTEKTKESVAALYTKDIDFFGYDF